MKEEEEKSNPNSMMEKEEKSNPNSMMEKEEDKSSCPNDSSSVAEVKIGGGKKTIGLVSAFFRVFPSSPGRRVTCLYDLPCSLWSRMPVLCRRMMQVFANDPIYVDKGIIAKWRPLCISLDCLKLATESDSFRHLAREELKRCLGCFVTTMIGYHKSTVHTLSLRVDHQLFSNQEISNWILDVLGAASSSCVALNVEVLFLVAEEVVEEVPFQDPVTDVMGSIKTIKKLQLSIEGSTLLFKEMFSFLLSFPHMSSLIVTFKELEQASSVQQHLWHSNTSSFSRLSHIELRCFSGSDSEVDFVGYMLRSTPVLVNMRLLVRIDGIFSSLRSIVSQRKMSKERAEKAAIVERISGLPKASKTARISVYFSLSMP